MDAVKTGSYLAALRRAKGLTQQETAEELGVSNKTISKWESGGGFPDITVLPALAEFYGVTADDILAGETLTDRRRPPAEETAARKRRLLLRLRTRFDVCFAIALVLTAVAAMGIPYYVSIVALSLSVAAVWVGYVLVFHPIRYGGVEAEPGLFENLYRKLLAVLTAQWWALGRLTHLGELSMDWEGGQLRGARDDWKPVLFCLGVLLLWAVLQWSLGRRAGREARLLPGKWKLLVPWLFWAVLFWAAWRLADSRLTEAMASWVERFGEDVLTDSRFDTLWPIMKARRDAELLPWIRARRTVLAAGGVSGLGLLAWTVRGTIPWKKPRKNLAEPAEK